MKGHAAKIFASAVALAGLTTASVAFGFDASYRREFSYKPYERWEMRTLAAVKGATRVRDAMWGQKGVLWVEVKNDGTSWHRLGPSFCKVVLGAGKPRSAFVIVSFWRDGKIIENVNCD